MPSDTPTDDLTDQQQNSDVELRDLVYQSLERDGLITLLKAQLRAAVFKTIEKASNAADVPKAPGYEGINGRICRALVLDWLQHARLLYAKDVLEVETSGPTHPAPLSRSELLEHLHLDSMSPTSEPTLHALLSNNNNNNNNNRPRQIDSLPEHIKQSIDTKFPNEKINDINRVREHFRSLFLSSFDTVVLDAFLNKNISTSASISKMEYEQICLKWLQACSKALTLPSSPIKLTSATSVPTQVLSSRGDTNNGKIITQARRSASPPSESNSSSSNSSSENPRKAAFDIPLPTIATVNRIPTKKTTDIVPPPLLDYHGNGNDDEDEDTTSSIFSQRNATPAALNRLKNIEDIIRGGDETPRTRTNVHNSSSNGNKNIPIEYDDDSTSQKSSVDDVTVDKASPSPSVHIDYLEDE